MPVPAGIIETSGACDKTVINNTRTLSAVREIASCGDSTSQLCSEAMAMSKGYRQNLLLQAQLPISVPTTDALAMKADLLCHGIS